MRIVAILLMSYGPDLNELFRQAAVCVDEILNDMRPGELPVQRPTRFERTAPALDLTIPPAMRLRTDRVIE